ncbi:MAG: DUF427 domain-containing protein [Acidimicrobiia bacterium]|nr:DUF427 domain-containing protein [Acidimicrobiia bacterium]
MRAVLNGTVIAESDDTKVVDGNHYFPPESIRSELFSPTDRHTVCPWKGTASYYTVDVDGQSYDNVGWTYPTPSDAAADIKDHVAFYSAVRIEN